MFFDPLVLLALVIVISIHEFSHAFVANSLGDPTAKREGRVTLNPLAHIDIMGMLMLFLVHIGWGKPVPVNERYFLHPRRDTMLTALAGPFSNLVLAFLLAIPLKYAGEVLPQFIQQFLRAIFDVSVVLFAFNILPFPPLDGSKIIAILVPDRFQVAYERYLQDGMLYFFLFLLFDQFVMGRILGFSFLQFFIGKIYTVVSAAVFLGT